MKHPEVINDLCVKKEISVFLHKKDIAQIAQTEGQMEKSDFYIPSKLCLQGDLTKGITHSQYDRQTCTPK